MFMIITVLAVSLAVAIGIILLLLADITRITRELRQANQTSALITSFTSLPVIRRFTTAANVFVRQAQASEHRRRQQEAEVKHMLTNLTHDIKTPLTVASGYVQILNQETGDARLAKIMRNLDSVNDYLRYLINYTLLQEKALQLNLSQVDLSALVTDALISNYDALTAKQLTVTPHLTQGVTLITDRTVMNRVVQNLIGNWLKYADGDLSVTLTETDTAVQMRFTNHSAAALPDPNSLQNRFATGDAARANNSVGLGLNIVHDLLAALDGTLTLGGDTHHFTAVVALPKNGGDLTLG